LVMMSVYLCEYYQCHLFFFSSRRRHTRFSRDWSSDVCSSDLDPVVVVVTWTPSLYRVIVVPATGESSQSFVFVPLMHSSSWFTKSAVVLLEHTSVIGPEIGRASCREGVVASAGCSSGNRTWEQKSG